MKKLLIKAREVSWRWKRLIAIILNIIIPHSALDNSKRVWCEGGAGCRVAREVGC